MTVHVVSTVSALESIVAGIAQPGDEILLRNGQYPLAKIGLNGGANIPKKGVLQPKITGNPLNYITIKSYPREWAWIQGGIELWAANTNGYLTFQNLEIGPVPTTRTFQTEDDVDYPHCFGGEVPYINLIDCYLHDGQDVWPMPITGGNWIIHGNLISNMGFYTSDLNRNRDYCIYTHNNGTLSRGPISIKRNCFVTPFSSWGTALWSATNINVQDYTVEENAYLEANILIAGANGYVRDNIFRNNYGYNKSSYYIQDGGKPIRLGSADLPNILNVDILNNYWVTRDSPVFMPMFQRQCNVQNNTFIHMLDTPANYSSIMWYPTTYSDLGIIIDNNKYHHEGNQNRFAWDNGASSYRTFANWQNINGWDLHSIYTNTLPSSNVIKIFKSDYSKRAFVVIYNWENLNTVTVDLSSIGFGDNTVYRLRNCANYSEHPLDFIYTKSNPYILIDMNNWTLKQPIAYDSPLDWYSSSFPRFGVFLVEEITTRHPKLKSMPNPYADYGLGFLYNSKRTH